MKIVKYLMIAFLLCTLMGCKSRVKIYTDDDAISYNASYNKTLNASMVSMKQINGDTVWTFQEKNDRGLSWQIIDDHYTHSVSNYEYNELHSNYSAVLTNYYLKNSEGYDDIQVQYTMLNGYISQPIFIVAFVTREELHESFTRVMEFIDYICNENKQYSDKDFDLDFILRTQNEYDIRNFTEANTTLFDIERLYLQDAIVYGDDAFISFFDDEEIEKSYVPYDDLSNIYAQDEETDNSSVNGQDEMIELGIYTYDGERKISSTQLYDYLIELQNEDIVLIGERDSYSIQYMETQSVTFSHEMIPFFTVEQYTGIKLLLEDEKEKLETENTADENEKEKVG